MNSGDAAESIVRMSLQGLEVAVKISGSGAKNISALLYAILKDQKQTKGKTTLTNMLKSGKPSKVFTIKEDDLKTFVKEAKRYGVLYCVLIDKKNKSIDGMVDIMAREEDASKINRIVERFKLSTTNKAEIDSIIEKVKVDKAIKDAKNKGVEVKNVDDKLLDEILTKPVKKEEFVSEIPKLVKQDKNHQSVLSLENKDNTTEISEKTKPSVKKTLKLIKEEQEQKEKKNGFNSKSKSTSKQNKKIKRKGR